MTVTTNRSTTAPTTTAPGGPAARIQPRRRRPGLAALGLLLVVLGMLGAYVLIQAIGAGHSYLAVARPVTLGSKVSDADLQVVQVNAVPGLRPIPADQRDQVVGRYARVDLVPGTLLTGDQLTDTFAPEPGQQLVGLELKPAQLPGRALRPGDAVLLVVTPDPRNLTLDPKATASTPPSPPTIKAHVVGVGKPQTDGQVVVDVTVSESDGPSVVSLASQGRIAIAVTPR